MLLHVTSLLSLLMVLASELQGHFSAHLFLFILLFLVIGLVLIKGSLTLLFELCSVASTLGRSYKTIRSFQLTRQFWQKGKSPTNSYLYINQTKFYEE